MFYLKKVQCNHVKQQEGERIIMISTNSKLHTFSNYKNNENNKKNKDLIKKYVAIKDKEVYAVVYRALHTIYYNLDYEGHTQVYLFHN